MQQTLIYYSQIKKKYMKIQPIILTLLLVAITIVGGSIIFSSSLESLDTSQISEAFHTESITILGYDATL